MNPSELLAHLDAEVDRRRKELYRAEKDREQAISKYCAEHPLPDSFVALMAERIRGGGALCCAAGREWLDGPVDAVWARVLSEWAYDALSCSEDRQERLDEYAQKVLDRQFEWRND